MFGLGLVWLVWKLGVSCVEFWGLELFVCELLELMRDDGWK